jgi:hypothetical protein
MRSFFKFVLTGIGLVLILIGVGALLVFTQAHDFFSARIGNVMSEAFDTKASISGLRFSVRRHAIVLKDFTLANPPGFPEENALTCAQVYVVLSPKTLLSREPVVQLLDLQGATVRIHHKMGSGSNLGALANTLAAAEGRVSFKVETLRCENGNVFLSSSLIPGAAMPYPLSKVEIKNLDSGKPVNAAKSTAIFLRTVLTDVVTFKGVAASVLDAIRGDSGDGNKPTEIVEPPAN